MQGFVLKINRSRNEDLVVTILTPGKLKTLYRFYGARHSIINVGYKIDFESQFSLKSQMPQLRNIIHLGFPWLGDRSRLLVWQQFVRLFYGHLREVAEIEPFYFDLLENAASIWGVQNPKRIAVESYVRLLEFEGRLHRDFGCFVCEKRIKEEVALVRAFLLVHPTCLHAPALKIKAVEHLFEEKSSLYLDDDEIEHLWQILLEGL